jgi:hypothetical protein
LARLRTAYRGETIVGIILLVHAAMLECAVTLSRDVRLGFGG